MSKPRILTFADYYLPGFKGGGPVRTLANLVAHLGEELEFLIVTRDRDLGDHAPYPGIEAGQWVPQGPARVLYLPVEQLRRRQIAALIGSTPHDTLYLNSLFSPRMTIAPLLARRFARATASRCVLAPRGELSPAALHLKPVRKRAYLLAAKRLGLFRDVIWQASTVGEAADIERVFPNARPIVAVDLPSAAQGIETAARPRDGSLRLVFMSRVSPMKNLDFALEALTRVHAPVHFSIYGPIEDQAYWRSCQEIAGRVPSHVEIAYHGPLEPHDVAATLAINDLFFLPTRGENFGHVVVEAWQAGLPVLISDRTPWKALGAKGIGSDLPLGRPDLFAAEIDRYARMTADEWTNVRVNVARHVAALMDSIAPAIEANRLLLSGEWTR